MTTFHRFTALFLFLTMLPVGLTGAATPGAGLIGKPAPACNLAPMGNTPQFDFAYARGAKVLYVDFWASWCAPCVKAFPFLDALENEYRGRGLQVVGINVDERTEDALRFLQRHRAGFTLARDATGACPRAFDVLGMPSSYLIDRRGVVRAVHVGFRDGDARARRAEIENLLAEEAAGGGAGVGVPAEAKR